VLANTEIKTRAKLVTNKCKEWSKSPCEWVISNLRWSYNTLPCHLYTELLKWIFAKWSSNPLHWLILWTEKEMLLWKWMLLCYSTLCNIIFLLLLLWKILYSSKFKPTNNDIYCCLCLARISPSDRACDISAEFWVLKCLHKGKDWKEK
jgi:hypothetical protein